MSKVLLGDYLFLRASREILLGEELTQHYCDIRMPVEMRVQELQQVPLAITHPVSRCLSLCFSPYLSGSSNQYIPTLSRLYLRSCTDYYYLLPLTIEA